MILKTIQENIKTLASENMTEDGIHHDDWSDREGEYISSILLQLSEINEIEFEHK